MNKNEKGDQKGCILIALKGAGAFIRTLESDSETKISVSDQSDPKVAFAFYYLLTLNRTQFLQRVMYLEVSHMSLTEG